MSVTTAAMPATSLTISSTSAPALNGTYGLGPLESAGMQGEVNAIVLDNTFADGSAALNWPDTKGTGHSFTVAQFKSFATAIALYRAERVQYCAGVVTTAPSNAVTIP